MIALFSRVTITQVLRPRLQAWTLFLALLPQLLLCATPAPDFSSAKAAAAETQSDIAVLFVGSDWNSASLPYLKIWQDPAFAASLPNDLILVTVDRKENPTPTEQALATKNEDCAISLRSFPSLAFFDSQGRLIKSFSGAAALMDEFPSAKSLAQRLNETAQRRLKRDQLWQKAERLSGIKRAIALGEGLDLMQQGLGHKNVYQPILDEIKKADPQDQSAYVGQYTFPGQELAAQILNTYADKKNFAEGEKVLQLWLKNPRLVAEQRQQVHAARFALYRAWPNHEPQARAALADIIKEHRNTTLGQSAKNYLDELNPPLSFDKGWKPHHLTPERTTWKISIPTDRFAIGHYEFAFHYTKGADALQIFGVSLRDRQGLLAKDLHHGKTGAQNHLNTYRLELKREPVGKVILETEVEAGETHDSHGNFSLKAIPPSQ